MWKWCDKNITHKLWWNGVVVCVCASSLSVGAEDVHRTQQNRYNIERWNGANGLHTTMQMVVIWRVLVRCQRCRCRLGSGVHRQRSFSPKSHSRLSRFNAMVFFFSFSMPPMNIRIEISRARVCSAQALSCFATKMKIFVVNANLYYSCRFLLVSSSLPFFYTCTRTAQFVVCVLASLMKHLSQTNTRRAFRIDW